MIRVEEFLKTLTSPDRVRITKDSRELYVGYLGQMQQEDREKLADEVMEQFRAIPEITHKEYKARGLLPPSEPDKLAEYRFSDLQMSLYYTIRLKEE